MYKIEHGKYPKNWDELLSTFESPNNFDRGYYYVQPTKRYAFVVNDVQMEYPETGRVLLIARSPLRERTEDRALWPFNQLTKPGRYVLFETPSGLLLNVFFDESYVQKIFADAKVPLPPPDNLGPRPQEMADWTIFEQGACLLVIALPFIGLWRQRHQFRKRIAAA
jgi:hypothetical protein